jgi:DNA-binding transcriptional LysR family regulator
MNKSHKKLERLLLFYEVAQHLSFSKAADKLGISRSYLSQQVRQLEQDFNTQLLIRTTRSVRLTREGSRVQQQAKTMHHGLLDLERDLEHSYEDVAGVLRLTAPVAFADAILYDVCSLFNQQYPEIRFDIEVGHHLEDLHERNFDLAIRVTENPPQNMVARHLMSYCHWVVASPDYWLKHSLPQHPNELKELNCMAFPNWRGWRFQKEGQELVIEANGRFAVNENSILLKAALAGDGVIRVPEHLLWEHVNQGRLQRALTDYQVEKRQVWMIYPPKIEHSTRLLTFVSFLREQMVNREITT